MYKKKINSFYLEEAKKVYDLLKDNVNEKFYFSTDEYNERFSFYFHKIIEIKNNELVLISARYTTKIEIDFEDIREDYKDEYKERFFIGIAIYESSVNNDSVETIQYFYKDLFKKDFDINNLPTILEIKEKLTNKLKELL